MSQPPPLPYALPPRKPRPRVVWWFVGGGLLLAGIASFVVLLLLTLGRATGTDSTGQLGPQGQVVMSVSPGERRMVYLDTADGDAVCQLITRDGRTLEVRPTAVRTTVTTGGTTWYGVGTFTSPDAQVLAVCNADPGARIRIGEPLGASFAGGIVATVLVPMALGGAGLLVLIVTAVLWFTRPPRSAAPGPGLTPPPGAPPGGPPTGPPAGPPGPPPGH